ncbi:MAG: diguanylate cyclase domain/uncharacterized domain [Capsulimonas sp.]|nr:diguanylate cyclase domain/uncharacterized domain [Capsulimonas sp.]
MSQPAADRSFHARVDDSFFAAAALYSDDAIIPMTLDTIILGWNLGAHLLYGYTADEMIGQPFEVLVPQDKYTEFVNYRAQVQQGEMSVITETERMRKDGSRVSVSVRISPVRDISGELIGLCATARDISDRKRAEVALRQSEERLRLLVDGARDYAMLMTDPEGLVIYWSDGAERILGYSADEIIGQSVEIILTDEERANGLLQRELERTLADGRLESHCWLRRKDGEIIFTEGVIHALRNENGELRGFGKVLQDATARRASEEALKSAAYALTETNQRLHLALDCGHLGSWQFDIVAGIYVELSSGNRKHLGLSPNESFTRTDFIQLVHPDDHPIVREAYRQAIEERRDYTAEYRVLWRTGEMRWISAQARLIYNPQGEPIRMIGVTEDITERKRVADSQEDALREAQERADRDPVTGLLNHRAFHKRLAEESARAQRDGSVLAVVMLDMDHFKFFNDAYGHAIGDQVLRTVAERLVHICRPYDTLSRFGGDEFALLLPAVGHSTRGEIEARLRSDLSGLAYYPDGQDSGIPIGLSVGVSLIPNHSSDRHEAVRIADERLRRAKSGAAIETEADHIRHEIAHVAGFSMLDAMVAAVDNKDRYTRRHSEDVMEHSLAIARELQLDEDALRTVAIAALLHDVGKIGVPDSVLRKPGALTDAEFEAIRQHPEMGAAIVSAVPGFHAILDAVRHHHERWDGGGYPAGLAGEETPIIARLMAVADAYSAMTTDRPYRQGMDKAKALSILEEGAGAQWCRSCVDAFLRTQ